MRPTIYRLQRGCFEPSGSGLVGWPIIHGWARVVRISDRLPAMLVEGPYLILYQTHPDTDEGVVDAVEIVRVVDGRRDLTSLF